MKEIEKGMFVKINGEIIGKVESCNQHFISKYFIIRINHKSTLSGKYFYKEYTVEKDQVTDIDNNPLKLIEIT